MPSAAVAKEKSAPIVNIDRRILANITQVASWMGREPMVTSDKYGKRYWY